MFNFFKREDWRLVITIENSVQVSNDHNRAKEKGKMYYHLYESSTGKRKMELTCTIETSEKKLQESAERMEVYNQQIYRWLKGRYDPTIPRYADIPMEDTANALRGKI